MAEPAAVRVDAWVWAVRLYKTRSAATAACKAGHVRIDGERAKPSQAVRLGAEVRALTEGGTRIVVARRLIHKRVGAAIAAECLEDRTPPPPPREERVLVGVRERGAGRPTKRDRRELDRLQGR
ncbi:RNA-binding S4 domain-containing protein [Homoserinibacter sp. YIM 151385]|uniref:RNA-binding S4 domain-containing protein n=1 Tax=Homoserinibacter sp. YIM 151385 TaxID=2985506 RepID=UPI0022F0DB7E|nr:S4 domain-containing protein [Homoserinibacter sp. YIM 151385]WBU38769.1 S4 domain-containing protein [Homoserinibacter sp. YIM 151385]